MAYLIQLEDGNLLDTEFHTHQQAYDFLVRSLQGQGSIIDSNQLKRPPNIGDRTSSAVGTVRRAHRQSSNQYDPEYDESHDDHCMKKHLAYLPKTAKRNSPPPFKPPYLRRRRY